MTTGNGQTAGTGHLQATERIAHIARIRQGNEADVRRLVERFPIEAIEGSGVREVCAFVGSGYLITEYAYTGEYTPTFSAVRNDQRVNGFMEELGRLLDDEPLPLPDTPAMQFLASQAFCWRMGQGSETTPHVRPKEASTDRV